jgi:hypothetical protein
VIGGVLVLGVIVSLIFLGAYSIRHPDRPPPGWRLGSVPPPARMKVIGYILLIAGIVVGLLVAAALIAYYVF